MITIRIATTEDAQAIRDIYGPHVESTPVSFETEVPAIETIRQSIADRLLTYPWLVAELNGHIVGYAYAGQLHPRQAYRWSVEVSVYIAEGQHRKGIASNLYEQLFSLLRKQGFRMAFAGISVPNAGSVGLHESFGFRNVANFPNAGHKFGQWRDVGWWALDLQPHWTDDKTPAEPILFREIGDA